ncbi:MAG: PRC-barrel domain-containing protein [Candidatus Micrarchaeota archaeon]
MATKISQLIGMDIFTDDAVPVGKVYDVIIDLQKGEVVRLTLEPIRASSKDEAKRVFREKTVMYKSVKAVNKIVIISSTQRVFDEEEEPAPETNKPMPFSYKYKRGM